MRRTRRFGIVVILGLASLVVLMRTQFPQVGAKVWAAESQTLLPQGIMAVWDLDKSSREKTPTRERVCLNGLWHWQPAHEPAEAPPADNWGYFKVPGFWPGKSGYLQEDCQTLHAHPAWKQVSVRDVTAAWHQREITVPHDWSGRRIGVKVEHLNSFAIVFLDGKKAGMIRFPAGEADLTPICRPGGKHVLSLLVLAMPLKGVMLSHSDSNAAKEVKGTVERRGLCGDVYLVSAPSAARIADVKVDTSVRKGEITLNVAIEDLVANGSYALGVELWKDGRSVHAFSSKQLKAADLKYGRIGVVEKWSPADRLWDVHTPQNLFEARVSLVEAGGKVLDTYLPVRFGFREFWIDGRDFFLNGTRIHLSAVPLDNAQIGARTATYEAARETMARLRSFGINFVYTHNYGCEPGTHLSFEEILRAADDVGMLVAFSQPHFANYDWKAAEADRNNGYAEHARFYVRAAQNHPCVVAYAMSHNATGYDQDMNPDLIDGIHDGRDNWARNNAALALRAEAIVKGLDASRVIYHHASGNLGSMHACNFYVNFTPIQEMSEWFEHWATTGVKPLFLNEYGVPFSWDWAMYRGWYKGERSFGSAKVPWEFCLAEWDAQFLGDRAFRLSHAEKENLRWEARQFRAGKLWNRWDYPHTLGSSDFDDRQAVWAMYLADNWRAHRTWGVSANSPWEYHAFWKLRDGVNKGRKELKVDWENIQKPGFSPDYIQPRQDNMAVDFARSDWMPTAAAEALIRNNQPLLAYIGGKSQQFTSKDHNFAAGETVEKQLILINNSRATVSCEYEWSLGLPRPIASAGKVSIRPGEQERIAMHFDLPPTLAPGRYDLSATVRFAGAGMQKDSFPLTILSRSADPPTGAKIALLDSKGQTAQLLSGLNVRFQSVDATADLSGYDLLIIGKEALTPDGPGPDVGRVREGLKVVVFEQTVKALEHRLGFRVAEYGLRQVFERVPDHPLLAGLNADHLHDWRGEATILPPRLNYTLRPRYGPTIQWCGIDVTQAWRCGCRGNVASVLIEKPARGDFLPVLDGGYGLQYSPLLEYREGTGMVLFCQMDVTGRTESDPAAENLTRNILRYALDWKPPRPARTALYIGDPAGKAHLESSGFSPAAYAREKLAADSVLIVGPGGGQRLVGDAAAIAQWLKTGGNLLAIGLDEADVRAFVALKIGMKKAEHIASYFQPQGVNSPFRGIGPADVHNRDPREVPLATDGVSVMGDGILAKVENANIVLCQLVPWQFDPQKQINLKRTFRCASRLLSRLMANMEVQGFTPVLFRFKSPVPKSKVERRWLEGLYLDVPEEWDYPYRFFRW